MPASRSVVSVLLRELGDFSSHPQGRPCGPATARRPPGDRPHRHPLGSVASTASPPSTRRPCWRRRGRPSCHRRLRPELARHLRAAPRPADRHARATGRGHRTRRQHRRPRSRGQANHRPGRRDRRPRRPTRRHPAATAPRLPARRRPRGSWPRSLHHPSRATPSPVRLRPWHPPHSTGTWPSATLCAPTRIWPTPTAT